LVDHPFRGGIVKQPFIASRLLDEMTKINQAWYTSEDYMSLPHLGTLKEQEAKNQEHDKSNDKLTAQLELLSERVIRYGENSMNIMSRRLYNDEV